MKRESLKPMLVLAATGGMLLTAVAVVAGPLDPPAGPVTSTHKTLSEVEPRTAINAANTPGDADSLFKITQPGSYYLTGNITGVVGKHGIEIAVSGVTLDLNGFSLVGVAGMGAFDGVTTAPGVIHVTVSNGSIRSWGDEGVELGNASTAVDLGVASCAGFGVVLGQNSSAVRCRVTSNAAGGIVTGGDCIVQSCSAQSNGGIGGIAAFNGCSVLDCTAVTNTGNGISTGHTSTVSRCSSVDSTLAGFSLGSSTTVSECAASFNDTNGFTGLDGVTISNCTATSNFGSGFSLANGAQVSASTARLNSVDGFNLADGGAITGCSAYQNQGDGISVQTRCHVLSNMCSGTSADVGTVGIRVTGNDNRIDRNNLSGRERGLLVTSTGNLIIANSASRNTINWDIAVFNSGQFVATVDTGGAVSGRAGGSPIGSTDPWVNFSFE